MDDFWYMEKLGEGAFGKVVGVPKTKHALLDGKQLRTSLCTSYTCTHMICMYRHICFLFRGVNLFRVSICLKLEKLLLVLRKRADFGVIFFGVMLWDAHSKHDFRGCRG